MRLLRRGPAWAAAVILLVVLFVAGCGGGGTTTDETQAGAETQAEESEAGGGGAQAEGAGGETLVIKMDDYSFEPKDAAAKAGSVTIEAPNEGTVEHELVLFKSDKNPADLPTESNGGVDEEKLDKEAEEVGEIADVEAGESKSETFDLTPGKYVMFCNLPGHYAMGMYGSLTVTK